MVVAIDVHDSRYACGGECADAAGGLVELSQCGTAVTQRGRRAGSMCDPTPQSRAPGSRPKARRHHPQADRRPLLPHPTRLAQATVPTGRHTQGCRLCPPSPPCRHGRGSSSGARRRSQLVLRKSARLCSRIIQSLFRCFCNFAFSSRLLGRGGTRRDGNPSASAARPVEKPACMSPLWRQVHPCFPCLRVGRGLNTIFRAAV